MNILVTDSGFAADDWRHGFIPAARLRASGRGDAPAATAIELRADDDPARLRPELRRIALIRVRFGAFADGRGFTIARQLRRMGYAGRLRAAGHVIADQYAMLRRCGFDEVEIGPELAARQPEAHWLFRSDWRHLDYRAELARGR